MTATALVVNGGFSEASFVPALLLFLVWTLGGHLKGYPVSPSQQ